MTINNRVCLVPALDGFRATPHSYYGTAAVGGAAGGPAGSASMTFFCIVYPYKTLDSTFRMFFSRSNATNAGWSLATTGGNIQAFVYNSTPAILQATSTGGWFEGEKVPYLFLASYQNGTLTFWANGLLRATTVLGAGFTAYAGPTTLGARSSTTGSNALGEMLSDCGFLDTYDPTTFVSALYGNGVAGLSAMWLADLREGRYLTWPRAGVANQDWYWAARDVVTGTSAKFSWVDRFTAQAMTRFNFPQGASFPARPT